MPERTTISLLSQLLIAFTMEFDNAVECSLPHRISLGATGSTPGTPWLISQAMWANFLRFIPPAGIDRKDLAGLEKTVNEAGLRRWGHLRTDGDLVSLRAGGRETARVMTPLTALIEQRWRARFDQFEPLRSHLVAAPGRSTVPPYLPVVNGELFARRSLMRLRLPLPAAVDGFDPADPDLSALLSRLLLSLALEVESRSPVSLPVATLLDRLPPDGALVRDLPGVTGTSREAVAWCAGRLRTAGLAVEERDADGRILRPTERGDTARRHWADLVTDVEDDWRKVAGGRTADGIRDAATAILTARTPDGASLLGESIRPPEAGWRLLGRYAPLTRRFVDDPFGSLARYPVVLHRSGWPDGS